MAEHLTSLSALTGATAPGTYGAPGDAGLTISERRDLALVEVACRADRCDDISARVLTATGATLPRSANSWSEAGDLVAAATGPGRWLVMSESRTDLYATLFQALHPDALVSDHSAGRTVLRITGPKAREVLAKGCALDLDARVFPANSCATGGLAGVTALILLTGVEPGFDIIVFRAFGLHVCQWLTGAAAEFGYQVEGPS